MFDMLRLDPMTKAAAHELVVKDDLVCVMTRDGCHCVLHLTRSLMSSPDFSAFVGNCDDDIERLQRCVGDVR